MISILFSPCVLFVWYVHWSKKLSSHYDFIKLIFIYLWCTLKNIFWRKAIFWIIWDMRICIWWLKQLFLQNYLMCLHWIFRIRLGDSLFYYPGGPRRCLATRTKHYCSCQEKDGKRLVNCDFSNYADRPKFIMGSQGWKELKFPGEKFYEIARHTC